MVRGRENTEKRLELLRRDALQSKVFKAKETRTTRV